MFRCDFCGQVAPAGSKRVAIITKTEEVVHPHRSSVNLVKQDGFYDRTPDNGGRGKQIRKEKSACPACAKTHQPVEM